MPNPEGGQTLSQPEFPRNISPTFTFAMVEKADQSANNKLEELTESKTNMTHFRSSPAQQRALMVSKYLIRICGIEANINIVWVDEWRHISITWLQTSMWRYPWINPNIHWKNQNIYLHQFHACFASFVLSIFANIFKSFVYFRRFYFRCYCFW